MTKEGQMQVVEGQVGGYVSLRRNTNSCFPDRANKRMDRYRRERNKRNEEIRERDRQEDPVSKLSHVGRHPIESIR